MDKKICIRFEEPTNFKILKQFPKIKQQIKQNTCAKWSSCFFLAMHHKACEWDEFLNFIDTRANVDWNQRVDNYTLPMKNIFMFRNAPEYIDKRCKQLVDRMTNDALNFIDNNSETLLEMACHAHCANTVDALIARAPAINLDMSIPTNLEFECKDGKGMCMTLYERVKQARASLLQNTLTLVNNLFLFPAVLGPVIVEYLF